MTERDRKTNIKTKRDNMKNIQIETKRDKDRKIIPSGLYKEQLCMQK